MSKRIIFSLVLLLVLGFAEYSYSEEPESSDTSTSAQEKSSIKKPSSGWYFGFGIGPSGGDFTYKNGNTTNFKDAFGNEYDKSFIFAINLHAGYILTPHFHLGFDGSVSGVEGTDENTDTGYKGESSINIANYILAVSYFPFGDGLFVKAGVGLARYGYYSVITNPSSVNPYITYDEDYVGKAALVGVGYYYRFGKMFSLGVHGDFTYQRYNKDLESSKFWGAYISCNWTISGL